MGSGQGLVLAQGSELLFLLVISSQIYPRSLPSHSAGPGGGTQALCLPCTGSFAYSCRILVFYERVTNTCIFVSKLWPSLMHMN